MQNKIFTMMKKMIVGILIFALFMQWVPMKKVNAAIPVLVDVDISFTSIQRTINSIFDYLKNFVLDRLANQIAKQILHQMTTSVINWINSGFQGSPAFLTNPEEFFLDVGDQITGSFLSQGGPLAQLCSPFGVDIRIALALQRSARTSKRYTCTLGKIINNFQNLPSSISINGRSVDGFMAGDFRQGGWPAFISMTTEPQNNIYGAYLQAQGDLEASILGNKIKIDADLNRGKGFLSWQKCSDVKVDQSFLDNAQIVAESDPLDPRLSAYYEGTDTYRKCETQTPGSVISGVLEKQLNVPATELELADDINAIIDALISQLVNQVLTGGLFGLSNSSGGRQSYTQQLYLDATSRNELRDADTKARLQNTLSSVNISLQSYKQSYDNAVNVITDSKNRLVTARACFTELQKNSYASAQNYINFIQSRISNIDSVIYTRLDPILVELKAKQAEAVEQIKRVNDTKLFTAENIADLKTQSEIYSSVIEKAVNVAATGNSTAEQDLANANAEAQRFNTEAARYQNDCARFPYSVNDPDSNRYYYY